MSTIWKNGKYQPLVKYVTLKDLKKLSTAIDIINGDSDTKGSIKKAIKDLVGEAPEAYDTLKEIADKLKSDDDLHKALNDAIILKASSDALNEEINRATSAETTLTTNLNNEITRASSEEQKLKKLISDLDTTKAQEILKKAETATTDTEKVNATITEENVFEVTDRTGTKKSLDMSGLVSAQDAIDELQSSRIDKTSILQESGNAEDKVMSQKAVSTKLSDLSNAVNTTVFTKSEDANKVVRKLYFDFSEYETPITPDDVLSITILNNYNNIKGIFLYLNGNQIGDFNVPASSFSFKDLRTNIYVCAEFNYDNIPEGSYISRVVLTNEVLNKNLDPRNSVTTEKLADKSVTAEKLADGVIRKQMQINVSDSEVDILLKMKKAFDEGYYDVYWEHGTYTFSSVYQYMIDTLKWVWTMGLPIGNNCRYYFNGSTLISNDPSDEYSESRNILDCKASSQNYELHDGILINNGGTYCVHDEGSGAEGFYKHVYDNMQMKYIKGNKTQYLAKCIGGGMGLNGLVLINRCIFDNGNDDGYTQDISWHKPLHTEEKLHFKIVITNSYFSKRGISIDSTFNDGDTAILEFANNSINAEDIIPSNITLYKFNNEIRKQEL